MFEVLKSQYFFVTHRPVFTAERYVPDKAAIEGLWRGGWGSGAGFGVKRCWETTVRLLLQLVMDLCKSLEINWYSTKAETITGWTD